LLLYAPASASSLLVAGGYLGGVGPISAPVTVGGAGILSPGTNQIVGTLAINGNLTLQDTVQIDVNKDLVGETNDLVTGVQTLAYGGSLVVNNLGTNALMLGATFQLFSAVSAAGNFISITLAPGAGLSWSFNAGSGVLSVVTGIATTPTNITFSLNGCNTLELAWPESHLVWIV
jgi:hypothetical protein